MINDHFKISVDSGPKNFVNFVKLNTDDRLQLYANSSPDEIQKEIDFLSRRIALNMFYYPDNIGTAKSDYISLLGLLIKKGIIFQEFKDLITDPDYFQNKG